MANCGINSGVAVQCRTFMPGIRRVFFAPFYSGSTSIETLSYSADSTSVITGATFTAGATFYQFDLNKEAGDMQEAIHVNAANGTVSYENTLSIYLSNYSTAMRNKIVALAKGRMYAVFEDRNGQFFLMGTDGTGTVPSSSMGVDMGESTGTPGKAYASDKNGYDLTFTSTEKVPPLEISAALMATISTAATS